MPRLIPALGSRLPQKDSKLLALEQFMVELVNQARHDQGLPQLKSDPLLAAVARAHSGEMRDLGYYSHESPDPARHTPTERYNLAFGEPARCLAENLCRGGRRKPVSASHPNHAAQLSVVIPFEVERDTIVGAHRSLLSSPGHYANIMHPMMKRIGIGLVQQTDDWWLTQVFAW